MAKEQINRLFTNDCAKGNVKRNKNKTSTRSQVKKTNREEQIGGAMRRGPDKGENKLVGWFNIA